MKRRTSNSRDIGADKELAIATSTQKTSERERRLGKRGPHPTLEETQVFGKICEVTKILQKYLEPLKSVSGNLHRMNMLITLCNKRLDSLDLKISEYEGKHKEPPGFEHVSAKKLKTT